MESSPTPLGTGAIAHQLISLIREVTGVFTEPAKIRRTAQAEADALHTKAAAEIETENLRHLSSNASKKFVFDPARVGIAWFDYELRGKR